MEFNGKIGVGAINFVVNCTKGIIVNLIETDVYDESRFLSSVFTLLTSLPLYYILLKHTFHILLKPTLILMTLKPQPAHKIIL